MSRKARDHGRSTPGCGDSHVGGEYTAEELANIKEVAAYMKKHKMRFLAHTDHLRVALLMGYRKLPEQQ